MSRPRNPNPPIRISLVKQKKYGGTWYVMERAVQYCNETRQTKCLYSHALGVLLNKDDDVKNMIPIDKWNEQQEELKQDEKRTKKKKKEKKSVTPEINETRTLNIITYKPHHLFVLMMAAFGAGHTDCNGASVFLNAHNNETVQLFDDFKGLKLDNDSLCRFISLLSKDNNEALSHEFNQMLLDESQNCNEAKKRRIIVSDGQAVRTIKAEAGKSKPQYVLSVCDNDSGLMLAHSIVGNRPNEIMHAEGLLQKVDISGAIVTTDALHATTRFIKAVLNEGGHYVLNIGNDNPVIKEGIEGLFKSDHQEAMQLADDTLDCGQGRIENRSIRVLPGSLLGDKLKDKWQCVDEGTVAELTSVCYDQAKDTTSTETSYLVSSLPYTEMDTARALLSAIRSCWGSESTHRLLDIAYTQDRTPCKSGEFQKGKALFMKLVRNFARIAMEREEKHLGKKISQESFKGIFSNITEFFRLYMDIVKNPQGGEA